MAARDETYRNQKRLDVVFALSSLAMLAATLWMFAKDHLREYKEVQRLSRKVEVAKLLREAFFKGQANQARAGQAKRELEELLKRLEDNEAVQKAQRALNDSRADLETRKRRFNEARDHRDHLISHRDLQIKDRDKLMVDREKNADTIRSLDANIQRRKEEIDAAIKAFDHLKLDLEKLEAERAVHEAVIAHARVPLKRLEEEIRRLGGESDQLRQIGRAHV